ncbi:MAG: hypothetical protein ACTSRP_18060, partial [Candidatus Helarchaeota archaeon]
MYTPYKPKEYKKLCPRDGTPLIEMTRDGKPAYYYCPICHYTKTLGPEDKKPEIKIKISEEPSEEKEEKELTVTIYQIRDKPVKVDALDPKKVSIIIDRENNYIWIWKGSQARPADMYEAGVQSTKLKSSERMYKAMVRRIEENKEPVDFLILEIPVREAKELPEEEPPKKQEPKSEKSEPLSEEVKEVIKEEVEKAIKKEFKEEVKEEV